MKQIYKERIPFTANDFEMRSIRPDRILLPYRGKVWDALLVRIFTESPEAFFSTALPPAVHMSFNVQKSHVRALAYIGQPASIESNIRICVETRPEEVRDVLDTFFASGRGLTEDYRSFYLKNYSLWTKHASL